MALPLKPTHNFTHTIIGLVSLLNRTRSRNFSGAGIVSSERASVYRAVSGSFSCTGFRPRRSYFFRATARPSRTGRIVV